MKALRPLVTAIALLLAVAGLTALGTPAQAAGLPAVRSFTVASQVDHAAKVVWTAPDTTRAVKRYRVAWGDHAAVLAPSARSYVVTGLTNGALVTVRIRPVYGPGLAGDRRTVQTTGASKPGTPGAPSLAGTDVSGGTRKAVSISWTPVAANGPGPVEYRVHRTGPSGSTVVCDWTTATSCSNTVANDGAVHTFQVRARNAEATSPRAAGHRIDYISPLGSGSSLRAYGPLGPVSLDVTTDPAAPRTVSWSFSIDPNGVPASWVLTRNGVWVGQGTTGTTVYTKSGSTLLSEGTTHTYQLTVSDPAFERPSKTVQASVTTPAPAPTVNATKGEACGPGVGTSCAGATAACSGTCWYVAADGSDFPSPATCGVRLASTDAAFGSTWTQSNTWVQTSNWVGPGTSFYVACTNGARSRTYTF